MVTNTSARAAIASNTRRCPVDGTNGTVCNVTITGIWTSSSRSKTSDPSSPPKMPNSCCSNKKSYALISLAACTRDRLDPGRRRPTTRLSVSATSSSPARMIPTRRTPTSAKPFASAAANVAKPQCVGGKVLRIANDGVLPPAGCRGETTVGRGMVTASLTCHQLFRWHECDGLLQR